MKTREEIKERVKKIDGIAPGIGGPTHMLALVLEVLLDIREVVIELADKRNQSE
jgi:hypothetical protein